MKGTIDLCIHTMAGRFPPPKCRPLPLLLTDHKPHTTHSQQRCAGQIPRTRPAFYHLRYHVRGELPGLPLALPGLLAADHVDAHSVRGCIHAYDSIQWGGAGACICMHMHTVRLIHHQSPFNNTTQYRKVTSAQWGWMLLGCLLSNVLGSVAYLQGLKLTR